MVDGERLATPSSCWARRCVDRRTLLLEIIDAVLEVVDLKPRDPGPGDVGLRLDSCRRNGLGSARDRATMDQR
jgi:hypothetical protein